MALFMSAILVMLSVTVSPISVHAADLSDIVIYVSNEDELRDAVSNLVGVGRTIIFTNNIELHGSSLYISVGGVTLRSAGNNTYSLIATGNFDVITTDTTNLTIDGVNIFRENGTRGRGIHGVRGSVTLRNGTISGHLAPNSGDDGGGIKLTDGSVIISGGVIFGNNANFGAGVYSSGIFVMWGGRIQENFGTRGGGVWHTYSPNVSGSRVEIHGGTFRANNAVTGGGIMASGVPVSIYGGEFLNNFASSANGGGAGIGMDIDEIRAGNLYIGANVIFNNENGLRPLNSSVRYMLPEDEAIHNANIFATQWTYPFTHGFNNIDIAYAIGQVVYVRSLFFNLGGTASNPTQPSSIDLIRVPSDRPIMQALRFPENPTRLGYIFTGWQLGGNTELTATTLMPNIVQGTTLFATWLEITVEDVFIDRNNVELDTGYTQQLVATIAPTNARNHNVTWSSNNPNVASVSSNGLVTAVSPGNATITVTTECGNRTDSVMVTVLNATLPPVVQHPVTIVNGGIGASASLNPAEAGQIVTLNPGISPDGYVFAGWVTTTPSAIVISNPVSPNAAFFQMIDEPVAVEASWRDSQLPGNSTQEPGESSQLPGNSTQEPGEASQLPGNSTQEPGESSQLPGNSTQEPGESSQLPGNSAQEPGESSQLPGNSTQDPGESSQLPGNSTQEPGESSQLPGNSTQEPEGESQLPGNSTPQEPEGESQLPGNSTPQEPEGESQLPGNSTPQEPEGESQLPGNSTPQVPENIVPSPNNPSQNHPPGGSFQPSTPSPSPSPQPSTESRRPRPSPTASPDRQEGTETNNNYGDSAHNYEDEDVIYVNSEVSVSFTRALESVTLSIPLSTGIEVLNLEDDIKTFQMSHLTGISTVYMSQFAWDFFANAGVSLAFELPEGMLLSFDPEAVYSIGQQAKGSTAIALSLSRVNASSNMESIALGDIVYRFEIMADSQPIVDFNGTIIIQMRNDGALPVGVWIMRDCGELVRIDYIFDPETYTVVIDINTSGVYIIRRNQTPAENEIMLTRLTANEPDLDNLRFVIGSRTFSLNGISRTSDVAPFIDPDYDRAMLPLRVIAENLGAQVSWAYETRTVSIFSDTNSLSLTIDEPLPNGMGVPVIRNDRTLVPLRYIAEILGAIVYWDEDNRAAYVYF